MLEFPFEFLNIILAFLTTDLTGHCYQKTLSDICNPCEGNRITVSKHKTPLGPLHFSLSLPNFFSCCPQRLSACTAKSFPPVRSFTTSFEWVLRGNFTTTNILYCQKIELMKFASKLSSDNRLQICHVWIVKPFFTFTRTGRHILRTPFPFLSALLSVLRRPGPNFYCPSELAALDNNKLYSIQIRKYPNYS